MAPRTARVPAHYVANFARQLAVQLASGIPILRALETLSFQPEFPHFGTVVECLAQEVSEGTKFSRALAYHPRLFSDSFVAVISIGEETGGLEQCLDLLGEWIEREDRVRRRMKSAMIYPFSVVVVSAILSLLLFTMVLPAFAQILRELNVPLPFPTRVTLFLTAMMSSSQFWLGLLLALALASRFWKQIWRSPRQARALFTLLQPVPGLGSMLRHGSLTRYCACSYASLSCGVTLTKSLRMAAQASANPLLEQDSKRLIKCVEAGQGLAASMSDQPTLYSNTLIQMVQVGEESSQLGEMFQRVGRFHELELDSAIEVLTATIEPLLLIGVSITVGGIVISVYLPMHAALMNLAA